MSVDLGEELQRNHPPLMVRYVHEVEEVAEALGRALSEWRCFELTLRRGPDPRAPDWAALDISTCELDHETMDCVVSKLIEKAELLDRLIPWDQWRDMPQVVPPRRLSL
jgi:hypothetical protein